MQFYSFNQIGGSLVRAQIDCRSNNCRAESCRSMKFLEIKTRAVAPIRYDVKGYERHLDYRIDRLQGEKHSFELEFFDMIRTVFLRYSLQIRLGQMRGAFICFHNTQEVRRLCKLTKREHETSYSTPASLRQSCHCDIPFFFYLI